MFAFHLFSAWLLAVAAPASGLSFNIPTSPPSNYSAQLSAAPVDFYSHRSFEIFAFPEYIQDIQSTTCLKNMKDLTGTWPPIRIGGTTQDRATYNASSVETVNYTVASTIDAPESLTYGPSFISLAASYVGRVIVCLNRRLDKLSNTASAALLIQSQIKNLYSGKSWTAATDEASQVSWQETVCGNLSSSDVISAGVYFGTPPMSVKDLASREESTNSRVKNYCSHNYGQKLLSNWSACLSLI
ncbi:hypothetical protein N7526_002035, partial [Penicillium atrosanguineum]